MTPDSGKIPPAAVDLEQAILGAIMVDEKSILDVLDILSPEMFYADAHKHIYKAILSLQKQSNDIDLLTVSNELRNAGKLDLIGGDFYLIQLTKLVASSAHIEFHTAILRQKYLQRQIGSASYRTYEQAYEPEGNPYQLLEDAYERLNIASNILSTGRESSLGEIGETLINKAIKIYHKELPPGLPTPFSILNKNIGGWYDSDLIIMAARPGMGKTSFALKCATHLGFMKEPAAFFSLEMSTTQLLYRIICMETGINLERVRIKGMSFDEAEQARKIVDRVDKSPIYIDDEGGLSIRQLQLKMKRMKAKYGIKMAFVDYIQLLSAEAGNREQEIAKISIGLKSIAKDLNIPIMALSQLNRGCESRSGFDKRPMLSDLRDSGSIEQDADMVSFLFRPEYYSKRDKALEFWGEPYGDDRPTKGETEIAIEKNRQGAAPLKMLIGFHGSSTNFFNLSEKQEYAESFF